MPRRTLLLHATVLAALLGGTGEARRIPAQGMFAYEDGDPNSLRHQAEIARTER